MFTLVILYTLSTLVYPVNTHVYPNHPVYPCISCLPMFTLVIMYTLHAVVYPVYPCLLFS